VRIERVDVVPYALRLNAPLRTARGTIRRREGLLLRIRWADGVEGWGEAAPLPGFGGEPLSAARGALEALALRLVGSDLLAGEARWEDVDAWARTLARTPTAQAALDVACHDAAARRTGRRVAELLRAPGRAPRTRVETAALLDAETCDALAAEARRRREAGERAFKLKVGGATPEADLARARAVREAVGPDATLRLDANRAWHEDEALRILERLEAIAPELVEEPLARPTPAKLARLRARSAVPVAADESLRDPCDADRLLDAGAADVFVLKPAWLGGLRPALWIAARARAAGVTCLVTTALDAAVGRAAALHLAAALGGPHAAGLDTGGRLADDVAALAPPRAGGQRLPDAPGLGVVPTEAS